MFKQDHKLFEFCCANEFQNTISTGTRLNPTTGETTLLDVILVCCIDYFISSKVYPVAISDHAMIVSIFTHESSVSKPDLVRSRCLNEIKLNFTKSLLLDKFL